MIPNRTEVVAGLYGAWRLFRLDPGGMTYFERSVDGFWKSFFAAALVAPAYVIAVAINLAGVETSAGPLRLFAVKAIAYVIGWVAFPLALFYLTQAINRSEAYIGFIVAYNWAQAVQIAVYIPFLLLRVSGLFPDQMVGLLTIGVYLVLLGYEWFIARTALAISGMAAAGIVLLGFALNILIVGFADGMIR